MTVVTAPPDDIYYTKDTPVEDISKACVDYFMMQYNWSEVSSFYNTLILADFIGISRKRNRRLS